MPSKKTKKPRKLTRGERVANYVKRHGGMIRWSIVNKHGDKIGVSGFLKQKEGRPVFVIDKQEFRTPSALFKHILRQHFKSEPEAEAVGNAAVALTGVLSVYKTMQLSTGQCLADIAPMGSS